MATLDVLTIEEAKLTVDVGPTDLTQNTRLASAVTALSGKLDRAVGPIVRRTITSERHDGGSCAIELAWCPVFSVSSVLEYQSTLSVTLTEETLGTEPTNGWYGERWDADPTLYSGIIVRRSSGCDDRFWRGRGNVVFTYSAGRAESTGAVAEIYKEAARITLRNWWRSDEPSRVAQVGEYDAPAQAFPTFAIPKAVRELLHEEWIPTVGFGG